jgi:hypothetical protein
MIETKVSDEGIIKANKRADRYYQQMLLAKARVYDLIMKDFEPSTDIERKARIIYLEGEVEKLIKQRNEAREKLGIAVADAIKIRGGLNEKESHRYGEVGRKDIQKDL